MILSLARLRIRVRMATTLYCVYMSMCVVCLITTSTTETTAFHHSVPFHQRQRLPSGAAVVGPAVREVLSMAAARSNDSSSSKKKRTCSIKICQNKHCKKNFPSRYDGGLPQVMHDIIMHDASDANALDIHMETTGCFSHCEYGPNVEINSRVFNKVNDIGMAAAILDVGADMDPPEMGALMAAVEDIASANASAMQEDQGFGQGQKGQERKISLLTHAIGSLVSRGLDLGVDLSRTHVMAHALLLRADARLEPLKRKKIILQQQKQQQQEDYDHHSFDDDAEKDKEIDLALDDAMRALSIHGYDHNQDHDNDNGTGTGTGNDLDRMGKARGWRIVADCRELQGDVLGAMEAIAKWGESNPSFVVKAKNEMRRLQQDSSPAP